MPISGNIEISCNEQPVLTICTIYDNNTPVTIEQTTSLASFEAIHDSKVTAHQALFNELKAKNTSQDTLIAQKANSTAIPTKLSQLTNDSGFITDTSDKANVSLSNITNEAITLIQSYMPDTTIKYPFCINSGNTVNGHNKTLSFSNATLTCAACTITTANGQTKAFTSSATLDCSSYSDGVYYVMKNYTDGSLELNNDIYISKQPGTTWIQPTLSANGTVGGNSFACEVSSTTTPYYAYKVFDNNYSNENGWYGSPLPSWITFYNPNLLRVTNLSITNYYDSVHIILSGTVSGSNDNTNWTVLKSFTNSNTTENATWNIDLSDNKKAFKYHRITANTTNSTGSFITELGISAIEVHFSNLYKENNSIIYEELTSNEHVQKNKVIIGTVKINNGTISSVYNNEYNKNILDDIACLPDYGRQVSIAGNTAYTAETNGWICTSSAMIKAVLTNETFTPTSSGYYFCPLKGN